MIRFVFSPRWFFGIDSAFEFLALGITALISLYCYQCYYKKCDLESYKYFSYSFFAIVLSFFFKILTNITILYENVSEQIVGPFTFTVTSINQSELFFIIGSTLHYFFFLLGLLLLYLVIYKRFDRSTIVLFIYFIGITTLLSKLAYFVFYITTAFFFALIFARYWRNYLDKRTHKGLLLALSFLFLLVSHVIFTFMFLNIQLYVVGETLQLFGFILLLITFMTVVTKHDFAKNKN